MPSQAPVFHLPGRSGKAALAMAVRTFHLMGKATDYDLVVTDQLENVLTGGDTDVTCMLSEDDVLALEREAIMRLVREPGTLARVQHLLETGKPLRN